MKNNNYWKLKKKKSYKIVLFIIINIMNGKLVKNKLIVWGIYKFKF